MKPKVNHLLSILHAGMDAVRPKALFPRVFASPGKQLQDWHAATERYLLCLGKAAIDSAQAVLQQADCRDHFVLSPFPGATGLNIHVGAHPIPDETSLRATEELLHWVDSLPYGANLLVVLSGGTSALLVAPLPGVSLESKMELNRMLVRSGASIQEINTVRKHLSSIKGGRLGKRVAGKRCVVLVISDVIGDDLASIGSGPFYPDPSTFLEARGVLEQYGLWDQCPEDAKDIVERGIRGEIAESAKSDVPVPHVIIASNEIACKAAAEHAQRLGYRTQVSDNPISGTAEDAAESFSRTLDRLKPQTAFIAGGEITTQVKGSGIGGRNQHLTLLMAKKISGKNLLFGAAGTDGIDGNSPAAGAWADGETFLGASGEQTFQDAVMTCDSYSYFKALAQNIVSGPTGTNVMDLYVGLT